MDRGIFDVSKVSWVPAWAIFCWKYLILDHIFPSLSPLISAISRSPNQIYPFWRYEILSECRRECKVTHECFACKPMPLCRATPSIFSRNLWDLVIWIIWENSLSKWVNELITLSNFSATISSSCKDLKETGKTQMNIYSLKKTYFKPNTWENIFQIESDN